MREYNGSPTQTQQSTHALPLFSTYISLSNIKNYCTSSDFGAFPNIEKFTANPQSPNKITRLLTPNPQKKHINRSSSDMVAKYQKLYRHSQRICSSNRATLTLRAVFAANSDRRFLRGRRRFTTVAHANSKPLPHRRSMLPLDRCFKSSKEGNLSSTPCTRYFSLRL